MKEWYNKDMESLKNIRQKSWKQKFPYIKFKILLKSHPDKNINKETLELKDTIDLMDLTGFYKSIPSQNSKIHILFNSHWNFLQKRPYFKAPAYCLTTKQ
jgi:hypothetical protein